jgi:FG-GAP repeat
VTTSRHRLAPPPGMRNAVVACAALAAPLAAPWYALPAAAGGPPAVSGATASPAAIAGVHEPGDLFGDDVALSNGIAVIGAWGVNNDSGAVYMFERVHGSWHLRSEITDPVRSGASFFGQAVAVSAGTAVVGASGTNNSAGAAYVYVRTRSGWRRQATLKPPAGPPEAFGGAVAISGGTAIIGAQGANGNAGAAYVYVRSRGGWHLRARLADPAGKPVDDFGAVVALSGGTAVFGAGQLTGARKAYVFARSGGSWRLRAKLADPAPRADDFFGNTVAVAKGVAVVGAWNVNKASGVAYVYVLSASTWRRQGKLVNPGGPHDEFGAAVAVSRTPRGLRIVVGAPNAGRRGCGAAYDFARSGRGWREKAKMADPGCTPSDAFGFAVAISGRTAIIGSPGKNNNAGTVYELTVP